MFIDETLISKRPLADVNVVIIHHTVAAQTLDITDIAREEIADQGFITVGYHELCKRTPTGWVMQSGRAINDIPAAAYGMNENSYDIALGGNYHPGVVGVPQDPVDPKALDVIVKQILAAKSKLPNLKMLIGHRDVATIMAKRGLNPGDYSTACPGDGMYAQLHYLRERTGLANWQ